METKEIQAKAKEMFKMAKSKEAKGTLIALFGKELFIEAVEPEKPKTIIERIQSFEDACKNLGISSDISFFLNVPTNRYKSVVAHYKLEIIAEALNESYIFDWNNSDEYKWYPRFDMTSSGFGFSDTPYCRWGTVSSVGSRLCFKTNELATYAGTKFSNLYKDLMVQN